MGRAQAPKSEVASAKVQPGPSPRHAPWSVASFATMHSHVPPTVAATQKALSFFNLHTLFYKLAEVL